MTREECQIFEDAGIWEHILDSEWASANFFVPKENNDFWIVTDFRELNKWIKLKPYPLPKVQDVLQKMEQFKYATEIDLRKGYDHIPLDDETSKLCTTVFPWGKYSYKLLPMGIRRVPKIFQKAMNDILSDIDYVIEYIDDILILSNVEDTSDDHLNKYEKSFNVYTLLV